MEKHKHCELIKAGGGGAEIQVKSKDESWIDTHQPFWAVSREYRIKPEKKVIKYRLYENKDNLVKCWTSNWTRSEEEIMKEFNFKRWITNTLRIEIDV